MKCVYFIRHAKSSWADASIGDIERPLNKRGLRDAPFMAKLLAGKGVKVDKVISSPANRAFTTAGYFAEEQGFSRDDILVKPEIYEAWTQDIIGIVQKLDNDWNTVLLFGHNPAFTSVVNLFADEYLPNLPTCGIVKIEADVEQWSGLNDQTGRMTDYFYPKQYFT